MQHPLLGTADLPGQSDADFPAGGKLHTGFRGKGCVQLPDFPAIGRHAHHEDIPKPGYRSESVSTEADRSASTILFFVTVTHAIIPSSPHDSAMFHNLYNDTILPYPVLSAIHIMSQHRKDPPGQKIRLAASVNETDFHFRHQDIRPAKKEYLEARDYCHQAAAIPQG
jgi:hypothetical protein